jgi:hypothetical protein
MDSTIVYSTVHDGILVAALVDGKEWQLPTNGPPELSPVMV